MFNESILRMPYCQLNFDKNKLGILPLWGALELISIFGPTVLKLRHYGLPGVLNSLLVFSYPGGKEYDKKAYDS